MWVEVVQKAPMGSKLWLHFKQTVRERVEGQFQEQHPTAQMGMREIK